MEFRDLLRRRRMVRSYTDEPVERDVVERIVATVRRAPSAGFSQGQRLLVVTDAQSRREIASIVGNGAWEAWIADVPVHIFVLTREEDYHERYRRPDKLTAEGTEIEWPVPYWFVDAGAAMMLLLLAAIDEGLAAGLFGAPPDEEARLKELLGIPDELALVGVVTVGYEAPDPERERLTSRFTERRRALSELVRWERWDA